MATEADPSAIALRVLERRDTSIAVTAVNIPKTSDIVFFQ